MIDPVLCWIETHPGLAAWVQAFFTLGALFIAIWVPSRIHKNESRERTIEKLLQAQGLSLLIRGSLHYLDGELERELQILHKAGYTSDQGASVELPEAIMGQIDRLWLMGKAGGHVLHLISTIEIDNRLMKKYFGPLLSLEATFDEASTAVDLRKERLQSAREDVNDALAAIEALLDAKL